MTLVSWSHCWYLFKIGASSFLCYWSFLLFMLCFLSSLPKVGITDIYGATSQDLQLLKLVSGLQALLCLCLASTELGWWQGYPHRAQTCHPEWRLNSWNWSSEACLLDSPCTSPSPDPLLPPFSPSPLLSVPALLPLHDEGTLQPSGLSPPYTGHGEEKIMETCDISLMHWVQSIFASIFLLGTGFTLWRRFQLYLQVKGSPALPPGSWWVSLQSPQFLCIPFLLSWDSSSSSVSSHIHFINEENWGIPCGLAITTPALITTLSLCFVFVFSFLSYFP